MHCDSFGLGAHTESFIHFVLQIAHNGTLREIESLYNKNWDFYILSTHYQSWEMKFFSLHLSLWGGKTFEGLAMLQERAKIMFGQDISSKIVSQCSNAAASV